MQINVRFKDDTPTFKVSFNDAENFNPNFREISSTFKVDFGEFSPITFIYSEWYEGPYTIDPEPNGVTINIKNLTARRDIVVTPYPKAYAYVEDRLLTIIGNFPIEVL